MEVDVNVAVKVGVGLFKTGVGAEGRVMIGLPQAKLLRMTETNKDSAI